ncbi:hypothetical protein DOTSEDRAFT_72578 [Dothistroma septosporum NZE10]|uniref:Uncharacterized protein n=1 Tax=Dothistroma septosporum (strain NZE10 / CBS 128990) TaxID=675120 RepID=M2YMM4_DOTSN|nr:hypothetical protein DOTSEDRAFT_72578 [Dothistroma septosporum NZE10]
MIQPPSSVDQLSKRAGSSLLLLSSQIKNPGALLARRTSITRILVQEHSVWPSSNPAASILT